MIKKYLEKHGRKLILAVGIAGLLLSVYFLSSGVYCFIQNSTERDSQEYYNAWKIKVDKDSYAVVIQRGDTELDGGWDAGSTNIVKLEATNNNPEKDVFIGIGREEDVWAYISEFNYDKITGLHIFPMRADYKEYTSADSPGNPASETFWTETSIGEGTRELVWKPESDNSSIVLMNADGSAGIDMNLDIKTKSALLFIGGTYGILIGLFILMLSIVFIHGGMKTRNKLFGIPLGIGSSRRRL